MTKEDIDKMFDKGVMIGENENHVFYPSVFSKLEETESVDYILQLIAEKFEMIIKKGYKFGSIFSELDRYLKETQLSEEEVQELMGQIDKVIADNFEMFISKQESSSYNYSLFDKLPLTKEKIKEKGFNIIFELSFDSNMTMNERIEICKEYFGEYNSKDYGLIKFCHLGKTKATIIGIIIEELRQQSDGEISTESITEIGSGLSANVYLIGDYVLKIGSVRQNDYLPNDMARDIIPNSTYIAQPIIRQVIDRRIPGSDRYVRPIEMTLEEYERLYGEEEVRKQRFAEMMYLQRERWDVNYIEVQSKMDMEWWKGMSEDEIAEVCDSVAENLLREGIWAWDTGCKNIAKTIKPNRTNFYFEDIELAEDGSIERRVRREIKPTQEGIRMIGEIKEDCLGPGEYVLVDTEYAKYIGDNPQKLKEEFEKIQRRRAEREERRKKAEGR